MPEKIRIVLILLLAASLLAGCAAAPEAAPPQAPPRIDPAPPGDAARQRAAEQIELTAVDEVRCSGAQPGPKEKPVDLGALSGSYRITEAGIYRLSGSLREGQIVVDAPKSAKVKLILDGAEIRMSGHAAIYAVSADKLVVCSAADSSSVLSSSGAFVQTDGNKVDAAIFAKCDLTFNGEGAIGLFCDSGHGAVSKDDLKIGSGTVSVKADGHGLASKDGLTVDGGDLSVCCGGDALHTDGDAAFNGGTLLLSSGDDAVHAEGSLTVNGGTLTVCQSHEGMEAHQITINGGEIRITASEDGLNASGGSGSSASKDPRRDDPFQTDGEALLAIHGGMLIVNADGDGLDSNGVILVTGGTVYVSGPTSGGDGAIDCGIRAQISGGVVIAAGSAGMAEGFGGDSTQGSVLVNVGDQQAGTLIEILDENGVLLASYSPEKSYQTVVASAPGMVRGGSYTLKAGSFAKTLTLDGIVYSEGAGLCQHP